jgi:hypothetical protein
MNERYAKVGQDHQHRKGAGKRQWFSATLLFVNQGWLSEFCYTIFPFHKGQGKAS